MKILILGASGLIGRGIYSAFSNDKSFRATGTYNSNLSVKNNHNFYKFNLFSGNSIFSFIKESEPEIIINCIGLTKHLKNNYSEDDFFKIYIDFPRQELLSKISSRVDQMLKKGAVKEVKKFLKL